MRSLCCDQWLWEVSVTCFLSGQVILSPLNWTVCRHGATRIGNDQSCCGASVLVSGTTRRLLSTATGNIVPQTLQLSGITQEGGLLCWISSSRVWCGPVWYCFSWLLYNTCTKLYFATNELARRCWLDTSVNISSTHNESWYVKYMRPTPAQLCRVST